MPRSRRIIKIPISRVLPNRAIPDKSNAVLVACHVPRVAEHEEERRILVRIEDHSAGESKDHSCALYSLNKCVAWVIDAPARIAAATIDASVSIASLAPA